MPRQTYTFRLAKFTSTSGSYSSLMVSECAKYTMKPVCDHPSYCRNDGNALYLGQAHHIAYWPHRNIMSWFPSGWNQIYMKFHNLCVYTNNANGNYALCNIPTNTHAWRTPSQYNPGFICGRSGTNAQ